MDTPNAIHIIIPSTSQSRTKDERSGSITEDHWRAPARLWPQGGWLQTRSEAAKQRRGERGARNPERESSGTDSVGAGLGNSASPVESRALCLACAGAQFLGPGCARSPPALPLSRATRVCIDGYVPYGCHDVWGGSRAAAVEAAVTDQSCVTGHPLGYCYIEPNIRISRFNQRRLSADEVT